MTRQFFNIFFVVIPLFLFGGSSALAQDINSNLIGHWSLDETSGYVVSDSTGNDDFGADVILVTTSDAMQGNAFDFSGANCSTGSAIPFDETSPFTISMWIKVSNEGGGDEGFIFTAADFDGFVLKASQPGATNALTFSHPASGTDLLLVADDNSWIPGEWHHVAVTHNAGLIAGTDVKIYVDGQELSYQTQTNAIGTYVDLTGVDIFLGWCLSSNQFDGIMDEVRLYDRALSQSDVNAIYNLREAGTIRYNDTHEAIEYSDGQDWTHAGLGSYSPNAVTFDGTNDYLTTPANQMADSQQITGSFWVKANTTGDYRFFESAGSSFMLRYENNYFRIYSLRNGGGFVLGCDTTTSYGDTDWHHILFSFDLSDTSRQHLYVDDTLENTCGIFLDDTMNLDPSLFIGTDAGNTNPFDGDLADLWIKSGTYIDFSVEENRRKFISANGMPMNLGQNGGLPLMTPPDIFLSGNTADWHINKVDNTEFTETGEITTATDFPGSSDDWEVRGTPLSLTTSGASIARLDHTTIAVADSQTDTLQAYRWDGSTWATVGNALSNPFDDAVQMTALTRNSIVTTSGFTNALRTFTWDGTDWTLTGNVYAVGSITNVQITALDSATIAMVDNNSDDLRTFTWDGTDWAPVGNDLNLSGISTYSSIVALNATTVLLHLNSGNFRTYTWDGTDWSSIGNALSLNAVTARGSLTYLRENHVVFFHPDDGTFQTYAWDGLNWTAVHNALSVTVGAFPNATWLDDYTIAYIDANADTITTYGLAYCDTPSRPQGTMIYNSDDLVMQYCNGTEWVAMGQSGGTGGGGCVTPAGTAGDIMYNGVYKLLQYCNSQDWVGAGVFDNDLDRGLVAHWTLSETSGSTITDITGNGNDGTWSDNANDDVAEETASGQQDGALTFDGEDDHIVTTDIDYGENNVITVAAWFKKTGVCPGNNEACYIVSKSYYSSDAPYILSVTTSGTVAFSVNGVVAADIRVSDGTWHHAVGTFDGETMSLYVDGVFIESQTAIPASNDNPVTIGATSLDPDYRPFHGDIDDVRIYNRVLTPNEIAHLYDTTRDSEYISGAVGHWALDDIIGGDIIDSSGRGNHGVWYDGGNDDVTEETVTGQVATALSFDGSTYITIDGDSSNFDDPFRSGGTVAFWVYPINWGTSGRIIDKSDSGAYPPNSGWHIHGDGTRVIFTQAFSSTHAQLELSNGDVPLNTWTHIAINYASQTLYVNGVATSYTTTSFASGTPVSDAPNPITLGASQGGAGNFFTGTLDDVYVYNRSLSDTEIQNLYNASAPTLPTTNLIAHWTMDQTSGSTVVDSSGNGYDGTWSDSSGDDMAEETTSGIIGSALDFDNVDDHITLTDDIFDSVTEGAISAWIRWDGNETGEMSVFTQKNSGGFLYFQPLQLTNGNLSKFGCGTVYATTDTPITAGQWHHVLYQSDSSGFEVYVDGVLIETSGTQAFFNNCNSIGNTTSYYIGSHDYAEHFDGAIDDFRIYDRMLSASEVETLYLFAGTAVLANGLQGHWTLDETSGASIADSSGNGNTGTWTDGVNDDVAEETVTGQVDNALTFDGTDDSINLGDNFDFGYQDAITISAWINGDNVNTWGGILSKSRSVGPWEGWSLIRQDDDLRFEYNTISSGLFLSGTSGYGFLANTWYHVAVVYDNTDVTFYINGVEVPSLINTNTVTGDQITTLDASIGSTEDGGDHEFDGMLDDVRFYSRALSAAEIELLYNQ